MECGLLPKTESDSDGTVNCGRRFTHTQKYIRSTDGGKAMLPRLSGKNPGNLSETVNNDVGGT